MTKRFLRGIAHVCAIAGLCASTGLAAEPAITVSAKQRYPWNGLVDLQFTITGDSGVKYDTSFTAKDMVGGTNITMATVRKADGTAANMAQEQLLPGTYNWVWDATTDLPKDWKSDRVTVTGTAVEYKPLYMVIDLSSGSSSSSYPISYLDAVPSGGWSDTYKTTKLVLRRIEAGSFTMGDTSDNKHKVTLTSAFYIGVFEITQKQYKQITGSSPANLTGDLRPVESISYNTVRGSSNGSKWPTSSNVDSSSFMGKMRTRTGLQGCDLPTSAQWEYACRAGTTTALNSGRNTTGQYSCTNLNKIARYYANSGSYSSYCTWDKKGGYEKTTKVGLYSPNKWGLYDMHGNAWEMCLDWYSSLGTSAATNPKGPSAGSYRVIRGGSWSSAPYECVQGRHIGYYNWAYSDNYNTPSFSSDQLGFRLCVTLSE